MITHRSHPGAQSAAPPSRFNLTGTVHLPPGTQQPWTLFTPRGEQRWAASWEPHFPAPAEDDSEPGTVFRTSHGGRDVTWVVGDRVTGRSIRYARVTEGQDAGSVTVTLDHGGRAAVVSYDLTALSPAGARHLAEFARGYPGYLRHWEQAIAATRGT
jgi:hypothetical protein